MWQVCKSVRCCWRPLLGVLTDSPFKGTSEVLQKRERIAVYMLQDKFVFCAGEHEIIYAWRNLESLKVGSQKERGVKEIISTCGLKNSYVVRGRNGDWRQES